MKELSIISSIIIMCLVAYFATSLVKSLSYSWFYEDLVRETVKEMMDEAKR